MRNKLVYTFEQDLANRLKNPAFRNAWENSEPEYLLAKELIEKRLKKKLSQRSLAKKLNTTQAVISRIETMQANPTVLFLKKLANTFSARLEIRFVG